MLLHGENKRVALVFFPIGHGHRKAAETLALELKKRAPATRLVLVDALVHVGPLYRGMVNAYLHTMKHFPFAQGVFYRARVALDKRLQDKHRGFRDLPLETVATPFRQSAARLEAVFTGSKWDMIVCTDPVAALIFSMLKGEGKIDIPVIMVATDFGVDAHWAPKHCDFFFVADANAKIHLVHQGIPEGRIHVFGIPIEPPKSVRIPKRGEIPVSTSRPFTVLCAGGGLGLGRIGPITQRIITRFPEIGVIAACGKNRRLFEKLSPVAEATPGLTLLGWRESLYDILKTCDVFIGKAGGLMVAEALAMGVVPIVRGGHPNASYLEKVGAGLTYRSSRRLFDLLELLYKFPEKLAVLKKNALGAARPEASGKIADKLLEILRF